MQCISGQALQVPDTSQWWNLEWVWLVVFYSMDLGFLLIDNLEVSWFNFYLTLTENSKMFNF